MKKSIPRIRLLVFMLILGVLVASGAAVLHYSEYSRDSVGRLIGLFTDVKVVRNVEYGKAGDLLLKLDIVRPKMPSTNPMPVVVFAHGGGWEKGTKESALLKLVPLARKGYFCATINFRLTDTAPFPAQIEDCKCAIRYLRAHAGEYNLDPDRIGVWGCSSGGHLAALLGTSGGAKSLEGKGGWAKYSSRVQAVADYFGPTDFPAWAGEARKPGGSIEQAAAQRALGAVTKLLGGQFSEKMEVAKQASPTTYIDKDDPPVFISHGENDLIVPLSQSQIFYDELRAKGVEVTFHIVKGQGHGFRDPETDKMVADFFDNHLREGEKGK